MEGMEDEDMKKETQNLAYPPAFKLEVALFAKKHSQYAAAKIFNVARSDLLPNQLYKLLPFQKAHI